MGRRKKKPTNQINWKQTAVDLMVGLLTGLILMGIEHFIK